MNLTANRLRLLAAAFLAIAGFAAAASAERVAVRSGEHEGFTRLVLDLPRDLNWELTKNDTGALLTLAGVTAEFDLSDAFRRLSAGRVTALAKAEETNGLAISLSCDCTTQAFRLGERMLVLDISGIPGSLESATAPQTAPIPAPVTQADQIEAPPPAKLTRHYFFPFETAGPRYQPALTFGSFAQASKNDTQANTISTSPAPTDPTIASKETTVAPPQTAAQLARTQRVSEAEKRLAEQLSRAAVQGLVQPHGATLPKMALSGDEHPDQSNFDAPRDTMAPPDTPGVNLRAQTSADRDFMQLFGAVAQNGNGARCFSDRELDIAGWATEAPFGSQLGRLRATLIGEFDRPNPDVARDLIKLYIHFGFGAEALHVMRTTPLSGDGMMLLKSMGEIMERGYTMSPGPLSQQFDCDTHAALWAVLAHRELPLDAHPNGAAILRAIGGLPPQIRSYLGPIATERLALGGHTDLAEQVLHLVERGQEAPDAQFQMANAGLQLADGNTEAATEALDSVVGANTELSPKALISLIDSRLTSGKLVDIQTADLAGAYALEYRKDPLGSELKRVHILALAEAGAYGPAFQELALFSAHASPEDISHVRSHAMAALARNAGDASFLTYALAIDDPETLDLAPGSANSVADRLVDLGFPRQADFYLRPGVEGADGRARRLIRARAALAQNKPRRAESDLLGLKGPEADFLRAEARSMNGDHVTAHRLFAKLDHKQDMETEAWLAADWPVLRETGDPLWQEAAAMTSAAGQAAPEGILARNRALIAESASARETMLGLLTRMAVDDWPQQFE